MIRPPPPKAIRPKYPSSEVPSAAKYEEFAYFQTVPNERLHSEVDATEV
jgi:hypothetical protein